MISDEALNVLFRKARTYSAWQPRDVSTETLRQIYDLAKMGPTSANTCPMRIVFVKTPEAKQRLKPTLDKGNIDKTLSAPVTAIIAHDMKFYERIPTLWPQRPEFMNYFMGDDKAEFVKTHVLRNGTLQAAYFILAARSLGLDCGPMSGFDNGKLDEIFFPDGRWKSNFLINLGYGDKTQLHDRLPRLSFDEACSVQ